MSFNKDLILSNNYILNDSNDSNFCKVLEDLFLEFYDINEQSEKLFLNYSNLHNKFNNWYNKFAQKFRDMAITNTYTKVVIVNESEIIELFNELYVTIIEFLDNKKNDIEFCNKYAKQLSSFINKIYSQKENLFNPKKSYSNIHLPIREYFGIVKYRIDEIFNYYQIKYMEYKLNKEIEYSKKQIHNRILSFLPWYNNNFQEQIEDNKSQILRLKNSNKALIDNFEKKNIKALENISVKYELSDNYNYENTECCNIWN